MLAATLAHRARWMGVGLEGEDSRLGQSGTLTQKILHPGDREATARSIRAGFQFSAVQFSALRDHRT